MEPSICESKLTISSNCIPHKIQSDARMIRQVLINIFSNAIKFTPEEGAITITGKPLSTGGYLIAIEDSGQGMSKKDLTLARELFGQAKENSLSPQQGTGLGIPLVDRFMKLLDGSMDIQSTEGQGTIVTLSFPAATTPKEM